MQKSKKRYEEIFWVKNFLPFPPLYFFLYFIHLFFFLSLLSYYSLIYLLSFISFFFFFLNYLIFFFLSFLSLSRLRQQELTPKNSLSFPFYDAWNPFSFWIYKQKESWFNRAEFFFSFHVFFCFLCIMLLISVGKSEYCAHVWKK